MALALPDIPRWVEPRSLLFSGECEVFGFAEDGEAGEGGFVVRDPEEAGVSVVGQTSARAIRDSVAREWEDETVFSPPEVRSLVSDALPGWEVGSAIFHLADDLSALLDIPTGTARIVKSSEIDFDALPDDLRPWLETTFSRGTPVAAEFSDKRDGHAASAVSFCCAVSITESLWDISVDTLPAHRNRGFAARCVSVMARHMLPLRPVWAAEVSNTPSMRLAAKLGFVPVDALDVFRRDTKSGREFRFSGRKPRIGRYDSRLAIRGSSIRAPDYSRRRTYMEATDRTRCHSPRS